MSPEKPLGRDTSLPSTVRFAASSSAPGKGSAVHVVPASVEVSKVRQCVVLEQGASPKDQPVSGDVNVTEKGSNAATSTWGGGFCPPPLADTLARPPKNAATPTATTTAIPMTAT